MAVLVGASLAAMTLSGGLDAAAAAIAFLPCVTAPWFRDGLPSWRGWALVVLGLGAIGAWAWSGRPQDEGVGIALVALMLHQRLAPAAERTDRLALLMAVLLLVGAGARTTHVSFFVFWSAGILALPLAAWRPRIEARTWPVVRRFRAQLSGATWLFALAVFFVLPRPSGSGPPTAADAFTGFADRVELGTFHELADDPTVVAEVQFERGARRPVRLRGAVLDRFDANAWTPTVPMRPVPAFRMGTATHRVRIDHADLGGTVLLPGSVVGLSDGGGSFVQDVSDGWRTSEVGRVAFTADVALAVPGGGASLRAHERDRYLELPDLDARVAALARAVVGTERVPAVVVQRVERHLLREHTYTRLEVGHAADPLEDFLFGSRRGHCEYFATAAAVLLRAAGVPTRVVTGFVGGEPVPGGVRIRGLHAHAWAEAHLEGVGWVVVDGTGVGEAPVSDPALAEPALTSIETPSVVAPSWSLDAYWQRHVIGHSRARQEAWVASVGGWWVLLGAAGARRPRVRAAAPRAPPEAGAARREGPRPHADGRGGTVRRGDGARPPAGVVAADVPAAPGGGTVGGVARGRACVAARDARVDALPVPLRGRADGRRRGAHPAERPARPAACPVSGVSAAGARAPPGPGSPRSSRWAACRSAWRLPRCCGGAPSHPDGTRRQRVAPWASR
jgi:transglutaminase-like putative cysteine protease